MLAGPPTILVRPQSQQVKAGGIASFYCTAEGAPPPQIHWRKNGKRVSRKFFSVNFSPPRKHSTGIEKSCRRFFHHLPLLFFLSPPRFTNLRFRSHFRDYFAFPFTSLRIAFKCLFFLTKFHARSARKRAPAVASRRASLYHTLRSIHARRTPAEIAKSWIGGECRSFSRAESIHPTGRLSGSRLSISRRDSASYRIAFDPSCSTIRCERPGGEERSAALRVTTVLRILQNRNDETSLLSSTISSFESR